MSDRHAHNQLVTEPIESANGPVEVVVSQPLVAGLSPSESLRVKLRKWISGCSQREMPSFARTDFEKNWKIYRESNCGRRTVVLVYFLVIKQKSSFSSKYTLILIFVKTAESSFSENFIVQLECRQ